MPKKITKPAAVKVRKPSLAQTEPRKRASPQLSEAVAQESDLSRYHEEIALLAYLLWEESGRHHGNHEENWFRAQEEIRRRYSEIRTMAAGASSR